MDYRDGISQKFGKSGHFLTSFKVLAQPASFAVAVFGIWTVFGIFMQYDIRPVLKIELQSMPVPQEPSMVGLNRVQQ